MAILLAGDIGGTKTILRLVQLELTGGARPSQQTLFEETYTSREFSDLVPMVQRFLEAASTRLEKRFTIEKACFGIAGPVVNNEVDLTNLAWTLQGDRLSKELGIARISLINDFAAVGYGVLGLEPGDVLTLQAGTPQADAPIAIIGAGTGLGQGFLVRHGDSYRIYPSEGGHADFAPRSEIEFQLLKYLRERYGLQRISAERVVSGMGIAAIYQFLRDRRVSQESPAMSDIYRTWERELGQDTKTVDLSAEVSKAATAGDYLSQETMDLFVEAYGAEAGNLALKLLPYGGLFIAGGIAAKNLSLMQSGKFMRSFLHKGRVSPLLEKIPVHIVLNPRVGLIGAALHASTLVIPSAR